MNSDPRRAVSKMSGQIEKTAIGEIDYNTEVFVIFLEVVSWVLSENKKDMMLEYSGISHSEGNVEEEGTEREDLGLGKQKGGFLI